MKIVPMLDLRREYEFMKEEIDAAIAKCLEHQRWILGPEVAQLEDEVAAHLGVKHCIGVSSGTDALLLSLRALAIKLKGEEFFSRDDEIITSPFTFTATGDAILRAGATPVFIDIEPMTKNIDADGISQYLTSSSGPKVVGVLPVHIYGQSCQMDKIMSVAGEHGIFVLEDVAQAFGGTWKGAKLGSIGTAGAMSFFPSKNLGGAGDAGMVSTNDDTVAELVRQLLKHGGEDKYNVSHIGYNARLDTLQAAILLVKMRYIDTFNDGRRRVASLYHKKLENIDGLLLPHEAPGAHHVYHQYTVCSHSRDELREHLNSRGISSMVYYPVALHNMQVFNDRVKRNGALSNTEAAANEVLSLPISPLQGEEDTDYVADSILDFFAGGKPSAHGVSHNEIEWPASRKI